MSALPSHTGGAPSLPTSHLPAPAFSEQRAGARGLPGSRVVASCTCGPWKSSRTNAQGCRALEEKALGPETNGAGGMALLGLSASLHSAPGSSASSLCRDRPGGRPGGGHCWKRRLKGGGALPQGTEPPAGPSPLLWGMRPTSSAPSSATVKGLQPCECPLGPFVHSRGHPPPSWS